MDKVSPRKLVVIQIKESKCYQTYQKPYFWFSE